MGFNLWLGLYGRVIHWDFKLRLEFQQHLGFQARLMVSSQYLNFKLRFQDLIRFSLRFQTGVTVSNLALRFQLCNQSRVSNLSRAFKKK